MKYLAFLAALVVFVAYFHNCSATSVPVCRYENSQGESIFLTYYPINNQDYVDFGTDGKCLKRATCSQDYTLKIEECSEVKLNCDTNNLNNDGVFPKCCVKC